MYILPAKMLFFGLIFQISKLTSSLILLKCAVINIFGNKHSKPFPAFRKAGIASVGVDYELLANHLEIKQQE